MKLAKHLVEKPWGRTDIPAAFGEMGGKRIGEIWFENETRDSMPILVKWLFTSEKLSIQVHPNDAQARLRGHVSGKEECWYIVSAEPGSVLGIGTIRIVADNELRSASISGEIENLMNWIPVTAGDYFYIPAGTVHAIGAGITLVEVQQYADLTYRLYDYGRLDHGIKRELHLDDGVAVAHAEPYADARSGHVEGNAQLVDGPHFWLWHIADADAIIGLPQSVARWVVPLKGEVEIGGQRARVGECVVAEPGAPISMVGQGKFLVAGILPHLP